MYPCHWAPTRPAGVRAGVGRLVVGEGCRGTAGRLLGQRIDRAGDGRIERRDLRGRIRRSRGDGGDIGSAAGDAQQELVPGDRATVRQRLAEPQDSGLDDLADIELEVFGVPVRTRLIHFLTGAVG